MQCPIGAKENTTQNDIDTEQDIASSLKELFQLRIHLQLANDIIERRVPAAGHSSRSSGLLDASFFLLFRIDERSAVSAVNPIAISIQTMAIRAQDKVVCGIAPNS